MALHVRPATPEDIPAIRSVASAAWKEAHAPIVGTDTVETYLTEHYDAASFRERLADPDAILDVATAPEDSVVGYVFAAPSDADETAFDLIQIYVAPDRWGEGIGRRLLEHVERTVRDRGGQRVVLGVMADNERAVEFYETAGYERTDTFHDDSIDARGYTYEKTVA